MVYTPSTSMVVNKESIGIYSLNTSMVITESNYDIQLKESLNINAESKIEAEAQEQILLKVSQSILDMQNSVNKWGCGAGLVATPLGVAYSPSVSANALEDGLTKVTPLRAILDEMLNTFTLMASWMNSHTHPSNGAPPSSSFVLPTYWGSTYPSDKAELSTMP